MGMDVKIQGGAQLVHCRTPRTTTEVSAVRKVLRVREQQVTFCYFAVPCGMGPLTILLVALVNDLKGRRNATSLKLQNATVRAHQEIDVLAIAGRQLVIYLNTRHDTFLYG